MYSCRYLLSYSWIQWLFQFHLFSFLLIRRLRSCRRWIAMVPVLLSSCDCYSWLLYSSCSLISEKIFKLNSLTIDWLVYRRQMKHCLPSVTNFMMSRFKSITDLLTLILFFLICAKILNSLTSSKYFIISSVKEHLRYKIVKRCSRRSTLVSKVHSEVNGVDITRQRTVSTSKVSDRWRMKSRYECWRMEWRVLIQYV